MKASISEDSHGRLRIRVSADSYEERLLLSAFMREIHEHTESAARTLLSALEQYGWWVEVGLP